MVLRLGVVGADAAGVAAIAAAVGYPDLVRVAALPDVVDLLLAPAALLAHAADGGTRARFVVVLTDGTAAGPDGAAAAWALGAELVVLGKSSNGAAEVLRRLVGALADGAVLGDALTAALGDVASLAGDAGLLGWTDLGALVDPFGGHGAGAEPPETAVPETAVPGTAVPETAVPETAVPDDTPPAPPAPPPPSAPPPAPTETADRWLQCTVEPDARAARAAERAGAALAPHAVTVGRNRVAVFVGPPEAGALRAGDLSDAELGFTSPEVASVRLTVVLVPLSPRGEPRRATLLVPRVGRSTDAELRLDVAPGTREVSARLLLLHRNRVLQTAVLTAVVGQPAVLTEVALVRPDLEGLRSRRRFDAAVVANHDATGRPGLMGHRDGRTTNVEVAALRELEPVVARLRELLVDAAFLPAPRSAASRATPGAPHAWTRREVDLLVELAVHGRDLHAFLEDALLPFGADLRRIQVVTARTGIFLPLELAYTRPAPDDGAELCPPWAAGGTDCGPGCGAGPDDTTIVCPAAFLGVRATIERHYVDGTADGGAGADGRQYLTTAAPSAGRGRLTAGHAALAASRKVPAADVARTLAALDPAAGRAVTWDAWAAALASSDTDLLVLLPHTDVARATLEISAATLARGRIEARHVTGGRDVRPVVLLLGCDTAGSAEDPAGFATRFLARDAAVVVSSLTMLRAGHAARLAERLAAALRTAAADRRRTPMGDLVATFRRAAVADGMLAALALAAYGDADWTV